jgi:N-acetylmuramoyl-L-alanine amidase
MPKAHLAFAAAVVAAAATSQQALFFHRQNLAPVPPFHGSIAAAMQRLCAGPDANERAAGFTTHIPTGTRCLAVQQNGSLLTLRFDATLLAPAPDCQFEHAIEQIDKTVLGAPGIDAVAIEVQLADGRVLPLRAALQAQTGLLPAPVNPNPPTLGLVSTFGSLAGRRIAISPGHGYYWHSTLGWITQRGAIDGLTEDIHTAEICNQYLIPLLLNLGADVVMCREHGERSTDGLVDNDVGAPSYTETGSWTTSASSGYNGGGYRFVATSAAETATATWTIPVAAEGLYPVFAWFRAGTNRSNAANYRIQHTGGISTALADQTKDNLSWVHLGNYWFRPAEGARITLTNATSNGSVVIADTVRLGGGLGSIVRGGGTSNQQRWRECARYWAQFAGAPATVYDSIAGGQDADDDVTTRPYFAEWRTADAFLSLHTNAGGGAGTETYMYSGGATAGSSTLRQTVHTQLIADLQGQWNPAWFDRGQKMANFGEVRELVTMPGILVELAFHDTAGSLDHVSLHQPRFRYLAARAMARGVLRYFAPTAPFPPEAPTALRVTQDGMRGLAVAWSAVPGATTYEVLASDDGKGFVPVAQVAATSWSTGPLPHHSYRSFRVRAWNATGRSQPSEVLTAGTDHLAAAQVLLVQGFDRLDRNVKGPENTGDYLRQIGDAIRRNANFSCGFDAASNEAVTQGLVSLANYDAVIWSLGEESTVDETFSVAEQNLVASYLNSGGSLLVHGAEVGWDLDAQGSVADRAFYRNLLGATYVADDAGVYTLQAGIATTVSQGLSASSFDNGGFGTYDVNFPDVLAPTNAQSTVCLRYGNGQTAGIQKLDPASGARVVNLGFPLETMIDANARALLVQQSLLFLLDGMPLRGPATATMGALTPLALAMPGEAGFDYWVLCSEGFAPGGFLPNGGLLPLNGGFLLSLSLDPASPFFLGFQGTFGPSATATPSLFVPVLPFLAGLPLHFAAFTLVPGVPAERQITNWIRTTLSL